MELILKSYQKEAVNQINQAFNKSNRTAIVLPTGSGKSFITLGLLENNQDSKVLFLSPSHSINRQFRGYVNKYLNGDEDISYYLYQSLLKMTDETMNSINPDIIILDELHRTGADKWGRASK